MLEYDVRAQLAHNWVSRIIVSPRLYVLQTAKIGDGAQERCVNKIVNFELVQHITVLQRKCRSYFDRMLKYKIMNSHDPTQPL